MCICVCMCVCALITQCGCTECGGQKNGPSGTLSSPNHPKPYPHQQVGGASVTCPQCMGLRGTITNTQYLSPSLSLSVVYVAYLCGGGSRDQTKLP